MKGNRVGMEVSIACADAAKLARTECIAAYPITPQTHIVEHLSELVANAELDAEFIPVESEHPALSVCAGTSAVGARTFTATSSTCSIGVNNASFNGQWVTFDVPIPVTYTCTESSATGCWFRLSVVFPQGTSVNDTTTWSAYILGEPVRIIQ